MADYDSNFESDRELERETNKRKGHILEAKAGKKAKKASREEFAAESSREEGRRQRQCFLSLDAYTRHKILINQYTLNYAGSTSKLIRDRSRDQTDFDVLKQYHRFLWDEGDEEPESWGKRMAKKYYEKLFKEYCISDLSRYKENKIAMRWRTEKEVMEGKGQFICGDKHCGESAELKSWEVNFAYLEDGQKKNALVKLRLCDDCAHKLNFHHKRREIKRQEKRDKKDEIQSKERTNDLNAKTVGEEKARPSKTADSDRDWEEEKKDEEESSANAWSGSAKTSDHVDKEITEEFDDYLESLLL